MSKNSNKGTNQPLLPHKSFYFIRHGKTDWNDDSISIGHTDIPLNNTGIAQAEKAAKNIEHLAIKHGIDHIYTSPLTRAKKTAEIINSKLNLSITIDTGLKGRKLGSLEGTKLDYSRQKDREGELPYNAETREDFSMRVHHTITEILNDQTNKLPLIISHGGIFRSLTQSLLDNIVIPEHCEIFHFKSPVLARENWDIQMCGEQPDTELTF